MHDTNTIRFDLDLLSLDLTSAQFSRISQIVYLQCGINLQTGKEGLVKSRLTKRLRRLSLPNFDRYLEFVQEKGHEQELVTMIDELTTNKTSFFRESQHFDYLVRSVVPAIFQQTARLRLWSAGCSSGEEPYSLGILLREAVPELNRLDCRILATDLSGRVLAIAREATYAEELLAKIPAALRQRYFTRLSTESGQAYRVADTVRSLVTFSRLNLMAPWPMSGPFDVIFCRNVMIYFDKPTQQALVQRFWDLLKPGGHLFVGHSESLASSSQRFRYVQPAVYLKVDESALAR